MHGRSPGHLAQWKVLGAIPVMSDVPSVGSLCFDGGRFRCERTKNGPSSSPTEFLCVASPSLANCCARMTDAVGTLVTVRVYQFASAWLVRGANIALRYWMIQLPIIAPKPSVAVHFRRTVAGGAFLIDWVYVYLFADADHGANDARTMRSNCNGHRLCDRMVRSVSGATCRR